MLDWINKEKIVFILALLLFVWGVNGMLSPEDPAGRVPRGKKLEPTKQSFVPPDLRLAETEEVYRDGMRDLFAEPVAYKRLKPLDLQPPPLARAPLTAPPPIPGPPSRHWSGLRHAMPPPSTGSSGTGSGGEAASTPEGGAATTSDEEKKSDEKVDPDRAYDSIIKKGSETRIYGQIRNPNPLSLANAEKDDQENQFIPKGDARLEFDYYDPKSGKRLGVETFSSDEIEVFSLARTDANLYAIKRRRVPPGNVEGRLAIARWLVSIDRVDWAAKEYDEALKLDPRRKEVYLELGRTLEREYLWEEALDCYKDARKRGIEDPALFYREGRLLRLFSMRERAVKLFRRALEYDRGDTRTRLALGECLSEIGRTEEAVRELKQAYGASAPTGTPIMNALWVDSCLALGQAYLDLGDFREAKRYYRAVVDTDQKHEHKAAFLGLGAALYSEGGKEGLDEALTLWAVGDASEISRLSLVNRGYALARLGRYEESRQVLLTAMREDPLHAGLASVGLAFGKEAQGDIDDALEKYEEALVADPTILYCHLAIGRIQRRQGDFEAAKAALNKVLEQAPDAVDALVETAMASLALNQYVDAIRYLERALELEPKSLRIKSMLGAALLRAQREKQAMDVFEAVLARRDDDPVALVNAAVVHYRRREVPKAIGFLQSTVESAAADPTMKEIVDYARRTAAAIEDNALKRLWEDDFNRTEIRNDWKTEHSHGVVIRATKGMVRFAGTQKAGDRETALIRTVSLGELVSFDAALTVPSATKANVGVAILARRGGGRGRGVSLRGAIQLVRDAKGRVAYRVYDDSEFQPWKRLSARWPGGSGSVRLGFVRSGERGNVWNLLMNGRVVKRNVEVKALRSWNRDGQVGVFGSAKIGVDWSLDVDDVRMILRKKK